jgi:phosphoglycerate dehydrogenase-like enzyme
VTRSLNRILFLQNADVLSQQAQKVQTTLADALHGAEVICAGAPYDVPQRRFDAVITPTLPWLPEAMARVQDCQWVHFLSAGVEKIWDMPVDWSGLTLTKSSGIHGPQMSEYAIGALLHFAKGFDRFIEFSRALQWQRFWLDELTGQTLMVLGGGAIGAMVGARARTFGMRVIVVKRHPNPQDWGDLTVGFDAARAHLGAVNALVVCVPLTDETRGMVGHSLLSALAPGAVLVDISRGGVVQGDAVADLLDAGHLRGAALDVFETQPLPENSRLWNRPDVLLTPHVSGTSPHYLDRALQCFIENAQLWRQGLAMKTPVEQSARY